MQLNTKIFRYELDYVKGRNDLCDCEEDLKVLKNIKSERSIGMEEFEAKLMPNYLTRERIGCYCPKCKNSYLITRKYEASLKIDFEDILSIEKMELGDLLIFFKLRGKPSLKDDYIKGIGIDDYYNMDIIKEERVGNLYYRTIVFSNDEELSNYIEILESNKEK